MNIEPPGDIVGDSILGRTSNLSNILSHFGHWDANPAVVASHDMPPILAPVGWSWIRLGSREQVPSFLIT
jgi:hypothetical protein